MFKRLFHGPKDTQPAAPLATAPAAVQPPETTEPRSFLTRLRFGKKTAPAAILPVDSAAEQVGPDQPKEIARQRASREPRAGKLSSTKPQPVVAANTRA